MSDDLRKRMRAWSDSRFENMAGESRIVICGVSFPAPAKKTGRIIAEENYFSGRDLFSYVVNNRDRMDRLNEALGDPGRAGTKLRLLKEIAKHYHTEEYTQDRMHDDLSKEIMYLDDEARDLMQKILNNE